ncbi:MAG: hypothetical protein Q4F56_00530 [Candidatus Saccharibacteria bacterium]|nr:hypothetical protein [Candidatus Saccharibacteria bacterium]
MPDDNVSTPGMPAPTDAAAAPSLPTVAASTDASASTNDSTQDASASVPDPVSGPAASAEPDVIVAPQTAATDNAQANAVGNGEVNVPEVSLEVAQKISEAHNVLVALSSDPSVDEMAAAIGLSLYLDKLGKRATAIYSGATPNALEFLKPEETFEPSVDTLQDFVIALNKEKADHLRYKLDGDYVKIYITPYKSRIAEEDLDFSYGDYNVDLVLALDVANGVDLDAALREHGRIMHDAVIINITTGNPGKLGEIEWSDKSASSVSEMIAKLLYSVKSEAKIEKEEATAFLTGIVAATNRFSNNRTTPETMKLASRLMESGANQQLVSKNITPDVENEMFGMIGMEKTKKTDNDPTKLDIDHDGEENVDESKTVSAKVTEKPSTLLDDLKAAEASLAMAGAETTPEQSETPLEIDSAKVETPQEVEADAVTDAETENEAEETKNNFDTQLSGEIGSMEDGGDESKEGENKEDGFVENKTEKVIQPTSDLGGSSILGGEEDKYGHMLEDALKNVESDSLATEQESPVGESMNASNPAVMEAPAVPVNPEINGVPEINYMPMPGDAVLPPPPAPPIDMSTPAPVASDLAVGDNVDGVLPTVEPIAPATPVVEAAPEPLGAQPAMQDQIYQPQAADPGAFKIPGT